MFRFVVQCVYAHRRHRYAADMFRAFALVMIAALAWWQPQNSRESSRLLVFTKTAAFRHESIPAGVDAVRKIAREGGFEPDFTEEASVFEASSLQRYRAVMFLNTSGDVLNESQQTAFEAYVNHGGGFIGVHAAADTEHEWEWYGQLVGARFKSHPAVQPAVVDVIKRDHPSTTRLPQRWQRTDEWYNFDQHPRTRIGDRITVLATLDESSYSGGEMKGDHPFAWCHQVGQGRAWYTAGGHTTESYSEPDFVAHLRGGIEWAMKLR